jgi:hypothetical protein
VRHDCAPQVLSQHVVGAGVVTCRYHVCLLVAQPLHENTIRCNLPKNPISGSTVM